jgi:hypothetical protein
MYLSCRISVADPGTFNPGSDFFVLDPGSWVRKAPDSKSGSATKNLISIFNPKYCYLALGNVIREFILDPDSDFFPSRITDQKAPDPGSATLLSWNSSISDSRGRSRRHHVLLFTVRKSMGGG